MEQEELFELQERMENATEEERMAEVLKYFPNFKLKTLYSGTSPKGANTYRVTIKNNDEEFTTTFTDSIYNTSRGERSSNISILDCVLMDAQCYENCNSLEDFADNFGYDLYEERSKATRVFRACERQYNNIIKLFGSDGYEILNCLTYGM